MKKSISLYALLLLLAFGCTDVEEVAYDQFLADEFYATDAGVNATLAGLYGEVRGDWNGKGIAGADRGWFDLNEASTDEMVIPTRSDGAWDDNGIWRQMHQHEWTPAHEFMNNTWNWLYRSIFKSNLAIELLTNANADASKIAEAKVLRAYFYYMLMDGWGDVPFYTENSVTVDQIPQASRSEVYNFVISEITENVNLLSETKGGEFYGRFNKWAAYALLTKIYMQAEVYTGTARWQEASQAADVVINEGGFALHPDYLGIFGARMPDEEAIMAVFVDPNQAPRNMIGIRSLNGPHGQALFGFSTWNGATAVPSFINKYEDNDARKAQWAIGPQPGDVDYTVEISSLESAGRNDGARNTKYLTAPFFENSSSNDFPVFRYADVLLMKAEAQIRLGQSGATFFNQVRARAGVSNISSPTLEDIYDERGRELCWEGHRRQDMIRFGKFLEPYEFKGQTDSKYLLFPIPAPAIDANPSLVQNPGY